MLKITEIFINSEKFPIGIDEDLDITWCAKSDKENVMMPGSKHSFFYVCPLQEP